MGELIGKVAIVTGASKGIGAAIARAFATAGAAVAVNYASSKADADRVVGEIVKAGGKAVAIQADVAKRADVQRLFRETMEKLGRPSILVNNAGVGTAVPALRETPEQFREVIDVNLLGAYWMAQAAAHAMPRGSAIVNVASVIGLMKSFSPQAAYAASKTGLIGLTRDLNQQWSGRRGIRVNAVAPGYFRSEMTATIPPDRLQDYIAHTSTLGRMGEQHELDAAVIFLASPASSYIAGVTLAVDGGMSGH